jgi:thymidylate synthase (methanogen type)
VTLLVEGALLNDVWEQSIGVLLEKGMWVPTERCMLAIEVPNLCMHVASPGAESALSPLYSFSPDFLVDYVQSIRLVSSSDNGIARRIFGFGADAVDQIEAVRQKLSLHQHSRRAIVSLWDPSADNESDHPPCLVSLQFSIREGHLNLTAVLRSNDAWLAALPDMVAFTQLQCQLAKELGTPVGTYDHLAVSYHLYETDYACAAGKFSHLGRST